MKHVFIINPTAGCGKSLEIAKIIEIFCKERKVEYKMIYTSKPGDATELIKTLGENNIVYSVGGDGTLKGVVNGIVKTNNVLSLIPSGSGNDFERTLQTMPADIHNIDLGMLNGQFFINIASFGLDAQIAQNAEELKNKVPNSMIYNASILSTLAHRKDSSIIVNDKEYKVTLMAICNGRYYGRGFQIAPKAKLNDGYFDIYMVDSLKTRQVPGLFLKLLKGTHETSKHVHKFTDYNLRVEADEPIICSVDGEIIEGTCFEFDLIQKAIKVDTRDILGIKQYIKEKQK